MVERNLGQQYFELAKETEGTFFPIMDTQTATNLLNLFPMVEEQQQENGMEDIIMGQQQQQEEEMEALFNFNQQQERLNERVVANNVPGVQNEANQVIGNEEEEQNERYTTEGMEVQEEEEVAWKKEGRFTPVNVAVFQKKNILTPQSQKQQKNHKNVEEEEEDDENDQEDRDWKVEGCYRKLVKNEKLLKILVKTRTQPKTNTVPKRIYSSLIYDIGIMMPYAALTMPNYGGLEANITLMNASTNKKAVDRRENAPCLQRKLNTELEVNGSIISGALKVKLNTKADLTYHKTRTQFYWLIDLTQNGTAMMRVKSAPFKVFARKPAETRKALFEDTNERPVKQKKMKHHTTHPIVQYQEQVMALADVGRKLDSQERLQALKLFSQKLGFSFDFLMGQYYQSLQESKNF